MTPRLVLATMVLLCAAHHHVTDASEAKPNPNAELLSLAKNASGSRPELAYQVNMDLRGDFTTNFNPEFRDALLSWMRRSSGMTLTLTLDSWNRVRTRSKHPLTKADVEMLVGMVKDSSYTSKTAREWAIENGKYWPCRAIAHSPHSILRTVEPNHLDRLIDEIGKPDARLRATFIRIVGGHRQGKLSTEQEFRIYQHFQDPAPDVRQAVAYSLPAMTHVPVPKLRSIFMSLLSDSDARVCTSAVSSIAHHPEIFNATDVAKLMSLAARLEGSDLAMLMYALGSLASAESPEVCDELIKAGIALLGDGSDPDKRRIIDVLGKAARFATQAQVDRVAERLCLDYQDRDTSRLPAIVSSIIVSGHRFSTDHKLRIVQRSLQILQSKKKNIGHLQWQAGNTASLLINHLAPDEKKGFVTELTQMLQQPETVKPSLQVLEKLGSAAHPSVPAITTLTQHSQDDLRITATATLWTLTQDSDTCVPMMLSGLKSNSSSVTRIASQTLIETGGNITRFEPQVVALLHDDVERTKLSMLQIIEKIGVDAKPLVAAVEPLTKVESSKIRYYATRTLNSIAD